MDKHFLLSLLRKKKGDKCEQNVLFHSGLISCDKNIAVTTELNYHKTSRYGDRKTNE